MKLSIIIPVYKVEPYLRAGLDSVVREWRDGVEVIAVNDGSPDGSLAILQQYAQKHGFIRVFDQKNAGVSAARNAGMDVAHGEWITFMDPDDAYVEGAIEYLLGVIAKTDADIVKFESVNVTSQTEPVSLIKGVVRDYDMQNLNQATEALKSVYLTAWNACYRAPALNGLRFVVGLAKSQDAVFGLGAFCRVSRIETHATVLYKYFQRGDSCVHTVSEKRVRGCIDASAYIFEEAKKWKWYGECRSVIFRKVRVASVGEAIGLIGEFPLDKRRELWRYLFDRLNAAFCKDGYVPPLSRIWYRLAFSLRSPVVAFLFLHCPYVAAQIVLKNQFIRAMWRKLR